jgi:hypothetical protein
VDPVGVSTCVECEAPTVGEYRRCAEHLGAALAALPSMAAERSVVYCGIEGCPLDLWQTPGPAGSMWCPVHGHLVNLYPEPPLDDVTVHLNYGGGRGETVRLEDL